MGAGRTPGPIGSDTRPLHGSFDPHFPIGGFGTPGPLGLNEGGATGPQLTGWPRKISWNEFKDVDTRPAGESEDAQIDTQTAQPERVGIAREQGQFRLGNFTVKLSVIRGNSWVVASQKSATLLAHEQGHFDITGLVARDLVKALGALRVSTTDELQREVSRLFETYDAWAKSLSKQYDDETNNSRNAKIQAEWEARIRTCIQQGTSLGTAPTG